MNHVVKLQTVSEKDKGALSRLLYDYQKELLPFSGESVDDIKTYKYLPSYFAEPERTAFFITVDGETGGFVLVNKHTILEKDAHSIAEFYIVPEFRGSGVGAFAAALVFKKFPGKWEVAQMQANKSAIQFWRKTIKNFTNGQYKETVVDTATWRGPVQTFQVRPY